MSNDIGEKGPCGVCRPPNRIGSTRTGNKSGRSSFVCTNAPVALTLRSRPTPIAPGDPINLTTTSADVRWPQRCSINAPGLADDLCENDRPVQLPIHGGDPQARASIRFRALVVDAFDAYVKVAVRARSPPSSWGAVLPDGVAPFFRSSAPWCAVHDHFVAQAGAHYPRIIDRAVNPKKTAIAIVITQSGFGAPASSAVRSGSTRAATHACIPKSRRRAHMRKASLGNQEGAEAWADLHD